MVALKAQSAKRHSKTLSIVSHNIDNDKLELAWRLVEQTCANVFITGKAGTGKTTFLRKLKSESHKNVVVLAPTGIAALNADAMTIHSFFQLSLSPFIPGVGQAGGSRFDRYSKQKIKVIRSLDMIVIDEISMVRADILDAIDSKLRKYRNPTLPMGGVQLVMLGDLQQLPPVVREEEWKLLSEYYHSPYFFDSRLLSNTPYETIELTKIYRQRDEEFIGILNAIRDNKADRNVLSRLNSRYIPGFIPHEGDRYIHLMTHNSQARNHNEARMKNLSGKAYVFKAEIEGEFPDTLYPADRELTLKVGAQVMFIRNDTSGTHSYYNGMIGRIRSISDDGKILVDTEDFPDSIEVNKETWENIEYHVDSKTQSMKDKVIGRFVQYPLRAAWAITIHKSQGLTFEKAIIDASSAFAHGQTYVALSRCRSLEGLVLERPLSASSIICDSTVTDYINKCSLRQADITKISSLQTEFLLRLQHELVDMQPLRNAIESLYRAMQVSHSVSFPKVTAHLGEIKDTVFKNIVDVSLKFQDQLRRMVSENVTDNRIQERISAGCKYFLKELSPVFEFIAGIPKEVDSKDAKKKFIETLEVVEYESRLKNMLMTEVAKHPLSASEYLKIRHAVSTTDSTWTKETSNRKNSSSAKSSANEDVKNPEVYESLVKWRTQKAEELDVPAYVVFGNRTLIALANELPQTEAELMLIPGIGKQKRADYGKELLQLLMNN